MPSGIAQLTPERRSSWPSSSNWSRTTYGSVSSGGSPARALGAKIRVVAELTGTCGEKCKSSVKCPRNIPLLTPRDVASTIVSPIASSGKITVLFFRSRVYTAARPDLASRVRMVRLKDLQGLHPFNLGNDLLTLVGPQPPSAAKSAGSQQSAP